MQPSIVHVKVFPSSKKEKFVTMAPDTFEAYVREPDEHNLANTRVREKVAEFLGVELSRVVIKTGHRARKKTLAIMESS